MTCRKFACWILALCFALQSFGTIGSAQSVASDGQVPEKVRIERLAGLGRLWGAVKYFHPFLAYKDIDWDAALIETIPRVNAARSPAEYAGAVNHMLSFLHDESTYAQLEENRETAKPPAPSPGASPNAQSAVPSPSDYFRTVDGSLIISMMPFVRLSEKDQAAAQKLTEQLGAELKKAKTVVIDARNTKSDEETAEEEAYLFDNSLRGLIPALLDSPVTLASIRYRMHSGYAPQQGGTSGGYYSAFLTSAPAKITGQLAKGERKSVAIIINQYTPNETEIYSGLQAAGLAAIVQEGAMEKERDTSGYAMKLADGVTVMMRTWELVGADGGTGFRPDTIVGANVDAKNDAALAAALKAAAQPSNRTKAAPDAPPAMRGYLDNPYSQMSFPDAEHRLLALFRFWNIINYFFPYKHLLDEPWENVLTRFIPQFEADKDALGYQQTVLEMVTNIHDSHGSTSGTVKVAESLGNFYPALNVRYVEGQTVVTGLLDEAAAQAVGVKVGDVVLAIDGEAIAARRERFGRLIAASTPQYWQVSIHRRLLRGAQGSKMKLSLKGADGATREVELERKLSTQEFSSLVVAQTARPTPVYGVLPSGYGYIDLARLQRGDADKALDAVMKCPALIFDMRGYPNGTAWSIAPRLTTRRNVTAALFRRPMLEATSLTNSDYAGGTDFSFAQQLPPPRGEAYTGKVVMLINEEAISQAEHTCLFFESATKVTFIGTPTAGANGDVTNVVLPGGITARFSGHDVRHADGRQLQRLGIQPDIRVEATVSGIRQHRDEILDAAIKFLQTSTRK